MSNFLLWIGGLLVVLLCALFAIPHLIDWNGYRGAFEEEASRILGREVRVAGGVNLRILPTPFVRFEKVRLSDAEGVTGEPLFRADDFTLWLSPGALLRGTLEANRIELHRPILKLRLNASGGGNWQTFKANSGSLPFVLSDAALQSVSLSDGSVSIDGPDGMELARLDSIGGEVTASALTGPFRFRGQANWNDEARALRLSTAAPEADGTTRFKLNVAVPKTGNTYVLDGRISDWSTKPKLDGTLTGSLRIAEAIRSGTFKTGTSKISATAADTPVPVELSAQVAGDADGAKLTELNLAFDQDGSKPQSLTGTVDARFQRDRGMSANLTSRWLDLDRILGWGPAGTNVPVGPDGAASTRPPSVGPVTSPLTIMRQMSVGLADVMPSNLPANVIIAADAVTLAGDTVNSVRFGLERSGTELRLKEFKAGFPGSTRVEATGLFPSADDTAAFEGDVVLRGANLGRFLSWAGLTAPGTDARNDGAFSLRSLLTTSAQSVSFRDITADIGGTVIGGSFQDDWSKRRRVDVKLEGSTIDLTSLAPGSLDFRAWRNVLHRGKPAPDATSTANVGTPVTAPVTGQVATSPNFLQRWLDPVGGDLNVQVRAGRLLDGSQDLRDVSLVAAVTDGRLSLKSLNFQSASGQTATGQAGSGLEVEAEGEIRDLNGQPTGDMRGWVAAQDGTAVAQLMTLLGLSSDAFASGQPRLLAPSRIAWTARFGNNHSATGSAAGVSLNGATVNSAPGASANAPPTAVDLTLDGALLGRRLMAVLRLDGGLDNWRNAPLDATLTLDGPDFPRLVQLLKLEDFRIGPVSATADGKPDPSVNAQSGTNAFGLNTFGQGRLSAKIVGRSAQDVLADVRFNDDGIDWSFAGRASIPPNGPWDADGEIRITAADLERAAAQSGLGRNASLANVVVDGSVDLFIKDGKLRLASRGLNLNGSALLGDVTLSPGAAGERRLDARLSIADASIPRLLDLLLDPRGAKSASADDHAWSKVPFDLARLTTIAGNIRLDTSQLLLAKGLTLQNAVLEAQIDKGRINISALDGTALGGRLTSKWSLAPATTGTIVAGSLTLTGSPLQLLGQQPHPPQLTPAGTADVAMTVSGQGASPAAIIGTLTGSGLLELANGKIAGISPTDVKTVIDGVMAGKTELSAEAVERAIHKEAAHSMLALGTRKLDIAVVDGAIRLAPLTVATSEGLATNRTTIDLANYKFDIEWRIDLINTATDPASRTGAATIADSTTPKPVWPRVSVVHLGHLGETESSVQRISVQALARELTVRKMERDVAELERLRRLDDERIRIETERLKAIDAAKTAAEAAAASPGGGSNTSRGPLTVDPGTIVLPNAPLNAQQAPPATQPSVANGDPAAEDAKRRAAELRAIEARRPQPAARKAEPFRTGGSP